MNIWTNKKMMLYFAFVLIIYDFENLKSIYILLFIENLTRFYTFEISSINQLIEIESSRWFYKKRQLQKFEKLLRIHIQIKRACVWISRNSFASKRFHNIKIVFTTIELNRCLNKNCKIVKNIHTSQICLRFRIFTFFESKSKHQVSFTKKSINEKAKVWEIARNTHSNRTCICLNISKFFCIKMISQSIIAWSKISTSKQFWQQANWIKIQTKIKKLWKMFIQIKFVFVFISQHFSLIKNLVHVYHVSEMTSQFLQSKKVWRNIWNTYTNQTCVCFWIFAFFARRQKFYQSKSKNEMQIAQLTKQ